MSVCDFAGIGVLFHPKIPLRLCLTSYPVVRKCYEVNMSDPVQLFAAPLIWDWCFQAAYRVRITVYVFHLSTPDRATHWSTDRQTDARKT